MKQKINLRLFLIALIAVVVSTIAITFVYYELFSRQVRSDLKLHAELLNDTEIFQSMYEADRQKGKAAAENVLKQEALNPGVNVEEENISNTEDLPQGVDGGSKNTSSSVEFNQTTESKTDTASTDTISTDTISTNTGSAVTLSRLRNKNLRITWVDADGSVIYDNDTDAAALENHSDRPEISEALKEGEGESVRKSETFGLATFYYAMRLDNGTVLRVAMQVSTVTSIFLTAAPVILIIIAIVLAACVVLSQMLTRSILQPMEQMAEHINDHIDVPIYDELKPFADKIRTQHEHILASAETRQDFTANVTHELKTPLTAISGYAELIENHMIGEEQIPHIASQIKHNSERLLFMINDIIELSELDHKDTPRNFANIDLAAVVGECCSNLTAAANQAHVTLDYKGNACVVSADTALIRELAENLIQNAIRYNRDGGHVWVTVAEDGGHPVLKVRDDGIGIPKDKQARVFERFYRVDKGRSRDMGGTGLGLAIVKHIAEIHNAEISLDSILGEGTDISVRF